MKFLLMKYFQSLIVLIISFSNLSAQSWTDLELSNSVKNINHSSLLEILMVLAMLNNPMTKIFKKWNLPTMVIILI